MNHSFDQIFLLSLPRSGSTLCQRMLAGHSQIDIIAEPNILLPLFYTLRKEQVYAIYEHEYVVESIENFCKNLPGGRDDYYAEIKEMVIRLYSKSSTNSTSYVLDKSPNYCLIANEIINLFEGSKFIFLWRNPLSIISSFLNTWMNGYWNIYHYENHLYLGLDNLVNCYFAHTSNICSIKYEDLVLQPEITINKILDYLNIEKELDLHDNFTDVRIYGDPHSSLDEYQVLRTDTLNKWKGTLNNPLRKRYCRNYLKWIGRERLSLMGYDLEELLMELDSVRFNPKFFFNDIYRMPYGKIFQLLDLRIFKHKISDLRAGKRIFMYR